MVVNCDRQRLFGDVLADHILIERTPDFDGFRNADGRRLTARILVELFVENALADINATVADVDARTGDELAHLGVAFATKRAHCEVGSPRHITLFSRAVFIPRLCAVKQPRRRFPDVPLRLESRLRHRPSSILCETWSPRPPSRIFSPPPPTYSNRGPNPSSPAPQAYL